MHVHIMTGTTLIEAPGSRVQTTLARDAKNASSDECLDLQLILTPEIKPANICVHGTM